jgi:ATP-binding cassette subfamily C protein LapB
MAASEKMEERSDSAQTATTPDESEAAASASRHPETTPGVSPETEPASSESEPESRDPRATLDSASKADNPFQRVGAKTTADTDREAATAVDTDREAATAVDTDREAATAVDTDREAATAVDTDREPATAVDTDREPATAGDTNREAADEERSADAASENAISAADILEQSGQQREWRIVPSQVDYEDPLLTCLSLVAGLLERPISREALKAGLPQAAEGFTPELAVRAAERAGLSAKVMRRPKLAKILPVSLPCILLLKAGNACVLLGFPDPSTAEVAVAEGAGARTLPLDELEAQYSDHAIFLRPEFKFDSRASDIRLASPRGWFWGTLIQFWPIYSHVLLASVLINCFAIASPLFIMNVYDRVVPNNAIETLWVLALGVATVFGFEFVMRNLRTYFVDVAGKNADIIIASRLLERVMAMRLDQRPPSTGALANNLREFESLREFFTSGTLVAVVDLPFIFLFIGVIWLIAGPVAFIPLAVVPVVILVGALLQFPLRRVIEQTHRESSQKHALLVETIDGIETIKSSAAEGRIQRAWERFVGLTAESSGKARFISGVATTFSLLSIQATTVMVVIYGVYLIVDGEITMGALIAATILTGRSLAPLSAIAAMMTRLQQSRVALRSLDGIMNAPVERASDKAFLHRPTLSGEIEFNKVSFKYPNQGNAALDELSFKIRPGERVGILGRIGSGKSTIARLCIGLYEPADGAVLMDGTDIRQIDPADLRRNVGYVAQDNYLFFGSVRDNVAFGGAHMDDQSILRAATVAGVTDFLRTHPHGFDLQVGERGMSLSGGQRQAVTVARALLLDPPILVLDEPTSCMDSSSEAVFKKRLAEILPNKTLVLITHRSSMLNLVDRLIIVDAGKVVADGKKEDVLGALKKGQIRPKAS